MPASYLCFDFGERRIGVAAGQAITGSASPVTTVAAHAGEPDWQVVDSVVAEWRPDALVVGIPLLLDGAEQPLTRRARGFARALGTRYGLTVHEADERLSSAAAEQLVADARARGVRRRTRKGDIDRIAACLILERWLADRSLHGD
ncbi:MAG: Holliday junction resolvase RuvX [Halofilum sp. (in: g-proteobacteria)]